MITASAAASEVTSPPAVQPPSLLSWSGLAIESIALCIAAASPVVPPAPRTAGSVTTGGARRPARTAAPRPAPTAEAREGSSGVGSAPHHSGCTRGTLEPRRTAPGPLKTCCSGASSEPSMLGGSRPLPLSH